MIIKEYLTKGKSSQEHNEDGLFIGNGIIAVIDGVTSKTSNLYHGFKSGKIAKDILMKSLNYINKEKTCEETLQFLNNQLKQYHHLIGKDNEWFGAQIIIYNDYYKEIWNFGDCSCMINGVIHKHDKLYDNITSNARALYNNILLKCGYTVEQLQSNDWGAKYIEPLLKSQYLYDNNTNSIYGYPVLNGKVIPFQYVKKYSIKNGDEIILASDGYPIIKRTLKMSEQYLQNVLKKDPLCIQEFISVKGLKNGNNAYDDRTYIRFKV